MCNLSPTTATIKRGRDFMRTAWICESGWRISCVCCWGGGHDNYLKHHDAQAHSDRSPNRACGTPECWGTPVYWGNYPNLLGHPIILGCPSIQGTPLYLGTPVCSRKKKGAPTYRDTPIYWGTLAMSIAGKRYACRTLTLCGILAVGG
jgi:hypothetical protein